MPEGESQSQSPADAIFGAGQGQIEMQAMPTALSPRPSTPTTPTTPKTPTATADPGDLQAARDAETRQSRLRELLRGDTERVIGRLEALRADDDVEQEHEKADSI